MNEITKKKISKKLTGRPKSATTKYRIKKSLQNRKLSDTHKKNISESLKEYHKRKKRMNNIIHSLYPLVGIFCSLQNKYSLRIETGIHNSLNRFIFSRTDK